MGWCYYLLAARGSMRFLQITAHDIADMSELFMQDNDWTEGGGLAGEGS